MNRVARIAGLLLCILPRASDGQPLSQEPPRADSARIYRAPEIVVTGSRLPTIAERAPVRVEVLQPPPQTPAGSVSVAELLEESAGILRQYRIRSGVQLMGLEPAYTLILLNGQPLTGRVAGVVDLRRIPSGSIERIEIVKGPMSSLYGSTALGGVINLITPRPQKGWEGQAAARYTTRDGSELQAGLGYGSSHIAAHLFGYFRHAQPFELTADSVRIPYAGVTEVALQGTTYWHPSSAWEFQTDARWFQSQTQGAFAESFAGQVAVNRGQFRQREWSAAGTGSWTRRRARLQFGLFGNQYEERYTWDVSQPQTGGSDDLLQRLGRLWVQYDLLWNVRYRFTFGGEWLVEEVSGTRYPGRPTVRTLAAFTQWEGEPYEWLSYALSLRWDQTSAYGTQWNPKAAFLLRPWGSNAPQLRFSVGTGFRAPDPRQLFVRFTNQLQGAGYALLGARLLGLELQAERSIAADAGLMIPIWLLLSIQSEGALEVRGFVNWVRNLIEPFYVGRTEGIDVYSYRNIARIATRGFEVTASATVSPTSEWRLSTRVAYQWLDAVDVDVLDAIAAGRAGTQDPTTGRFIPLRRSEYGGLWGRSRHTLAGRLQLQYAPTMTWLTFHFHHRSRFGDEALDRNGVAVLNPPRRVLDRPDEYVPGYWNISAWLSQSWRISPATVSWSIGIRNILNISNPRFLPHFVGRQWFIGCEARWGTTER
ncbi:MAG: TonB-dependent receptor [Chlorobiota bacterium]